MEATKRNKEIISEKMTREQIAEAQKLSREQLDRSSAPAPDNASNVSGDQPSLGRSINGMLRTRNSDSK